MDFDSIPDDYVPKGVTDEWIDETTNYLKNHPLFIKDMPDELEKNEEILAL
jgi:hypothetical protein